MSLKLEDVALLGVLSMLLVAMAVPACQKIAETRHADTPPPGFSIVTDHHGKWSWKDGYFVAVEGGQEYNSFDAANNAAWEQYKFDQANPEISDINRKRASEFTAP